MRVLLAEDDCMIGKAMEAALHDEAYAVDWVRDGQSALQAAQDHHYDVLLLDLGLPRRDGMQVLQALRGRNNHVPLIIITARTSLDDRLSGLDGGADDYLPKPFEMAELLARMRAVTRRMQGVATPSFSNGYLSLDPATKEVTRAGELVRLSAREYALLLVLLKRAGAILSRRELEDGIYGWGEEVESNAVEFLIHGLRRKLGNEAIRNVRGMGWMVPKGA